MPAEAQWEYACRAGTIRAYNDDTKNGGEGSDCLNDGSGTDSNLDPLGRYSYKGGSRSKHANVGSYQANTWGLYDMHGNVYEWCLDWYSYSYGGDATDPVGTGVVWPTSRRVTRGGNWLGMASYCRSANRFDDSPDFADHGLGFRLASAAE